MVKLTKSLNDFCTASAAGGASTSSGAASVLTGAGELDFSSTGAAFVAFFDLIMTFGGASSAIFRFLTDEDIFACCCLSKGALESCRIEVVPPGKFLSLIAILI